MLGNSENFQKLGGAHPRPRGRHIPDENNESEISKASLLISGSDLIEGRNITNAFSLLTIDNFELINEQFVNKDIYFLYKKFKNNTIILNTMFKALEGKENRKH